MAITRTPMVDDDGTGTTGTVINNAWKQQFYDQIDAAAGSGLVDWTAVPFNVGDYSCSGGGTWTVDAADVQVFRYCVFSNAPKLALVTITINSTTIAGTVNWLTIRLPGGLVAPILFGWSGRIMEGGQPRALGWFYANGANFNVEKVPYTPFVVQTNALSIMATLIFQVN